MEHGLETLLEASHAIRDYPDIHFLLIGDGAERQNLILRAKKLKLTNVTISPLQPKEKIAEHIASSDLGIVVVRNIPLFRTIISAKIFEYLAMKKPVILATGESEGSELIKRHNCGLVIEPENSLQLKDAILKLYKYKNLRKELRKHQFDFHIWSEVHNEFLQAFFEFCLVGIVLIGLYIFNLFKRFFFYSMY